MTRFDPSRWQIPQWHADWDGDFHFAGLRMFANRLHDSTDLDAMLSLIEEGYVHVDVFDGAMRIGLVYVNRGDDASIPLFTVYAGSEDDELTTTDITAAVRFLDQHRTAFPEDAE